VLLSLSRFSYMYSCFRPIDESKCVTEVYAPTTVTDLTFFMFPTTPIPPGYGGVLYYSKPPYTDWELLGCVSPEKPSGVFRTGWTTNEDMVGCEVVQLGVSIEP
jgi:protein Hikeshi